MIHLATAAELGLLDEAIDMMDREFIFGRGRTLSFRTRVPDVYSPANAGSILCLTDDGILQSALALREVYLEGKDFRLRGAMIGGVVTQPESRGHGYGSKLMQWCVEVMRERGLDCGLLWSGKPGFYERLGWRRGSGVLYGKFTEPLHVPPPGVSKTLIVRQFTSTEELKALEEFRLSRQPIRLTWTQPPWRRYGRLPVPSTAWEAWGVVDAEGMLCGQSLIGLAPDSATIYEFTGVESARQTVLSQLSDRASDIYFNAMDEAEFAEYEKFGRVERQPTSASLYLPVTSAIPELIIQHIEQLVVPYYDRI